MPQKYLLQISYIGTNFSGWQKQKHTCKTIQGDIEKAIEKITKTSVDIFCAGRTDAGVHAYLQYAHFETDKILPERAWLLGINQYLSSEISIQEVQKVDTDFHARFSATARRYCYIIANTPIKLAHHHKRVTFVHRPLDLNLMQEACQYLIGEQDFSSFRSSECQAKHAVRNITHASIYQNNNWIIFDITANAFLHHMVRNIVGSLLLVGKEKHAPIWIKEVIQKQNRIFAGPTADADGLYLVDVVYKFPYNDLPKPKYPFTYLNEHF